MKKITFDSLQRELKKQAGLFQQSVDIVQLQNLEYAIHRIQPVHHQECTFVTWCGTRSESVTKHIDEYVNRRSGRSSQMKDHPLFDLTSWCVPESYRILVYKEQFQALIRELTGCGTVKASEVLTDVLRTNYAYGYLQPMLIDTWQKTLTCKDQEVIFDLIHDSYPRSIPYAWCSTIVDRALNC